MSNGPSGRFETRDGRLWYRIDGVDLLDPFLMTIVSPSDHWMFVSSSGSLTAGRRSSRESLFEYQTDDRLHRSGGRTGPVTAIRAGDRVWMPFDPRAAQGTVHRSIAKTTTGDRVVFEEHEPSVGLTFAFEWAMTEHFGFVRTCRLTATHETEVEILDGLSDVLPCGVDPWTQQFASTLVDGYRRAEIEPEDGLAVFTLEAQVSDAPEPAESLTANVVWASGLDGVVTLSPTAVQAFTSGLDPTERHLVTGEKAGYFLVSRHRMRPGDPVSWRLVMDVGVDHRRLAEIREARRDPAIDSALTSAIEESTRALRAIVGGADGIQVTADRLATTHHFANVLFNSMRGGTFRDGHDVDVDDVTRFVSERNHVAAPRFESIAGELPKRTSISALRNVVRHDPDLVRLVDEYLPLTFSRRHGDPSRPWNIFQIPKGAAIGYQGNWRDIFQNWEALGHSFPEYVESFVAKFLNASTVDGFNPYRISHDGIDWEIPEEGSWANFGYWGDHQIVYLQRLIELLERTAPGHLASELSHAAYSYSNVPYRLHAYESILNESKRTIAFDHEAHERIQRRIASVGTDARLVLDRSGAVIHVTLCEKLLVPALAKLSNLVAGGGIWMNTQRPEWNDANNALVGHGVSTVTAIHLIEYISTVRALIEAADTSSYQLSKSVGDWIEALAHALEAADPDATAADPGARRSLLDALGRAFEDHRTSSYGVGPGDPEEVPSTSISRLLETATAHLHACLRARTRDDGLVDSYGLLHLGRDTADFEPLHVMLEGQVAALSSPAVDHLRAIEIVDALYDSPLHRPDQKTFVLYPATPRPPFRLKNVIPEDLLGTVALEIVTRDRGLLYRDGEDVVRFSSDISSRRDLPDALARLESETGPLPDGALEDLQRIHEAVFRHAAFTGRSGTMYRYEGLGSVYWHMVSKLVVAVQERALDAARNLGPDHETTRALIDRYDRLRAGLGYHKSVREQGTFPTDPHSHTPAHTGAQQPGMTGQVKEGVLLRWGELGVSFAEGRVSFDPILLEPSEFLGEPTPWEALGDDELEPGQLGFTLCGVPIVFSLGSTARVTVMRTDGSVATNGPVLDRGTSAELMARAGTLRRIDVEVDPVRLGLR